MLITLVTDKRASMAGRKTNRIPYTDNRRLSQPRELVATHHFDRCKWWSGEIVDFHLQMTPDLKEIICKKPTTQIIKQKWRIPIQSLKGIIAGIKQGDAFSKKGGLFSKSTHLHNPSQSHHYPRAQ